jgi:hypothetical protein
MRLPEEGLPLRDVIRVFTVFSRILTTLSVAPTPPRWYNGRLLMRDFPHLFRGRAREAAIRRHTSSSQSLMGVPT